MPTDDEIYALVREAAGAYGYTFEESPDGREVKLIRPDGTVAVKARKRPAYICALCAATWAGAREDHACSRNN